MCAHVYMLITRLCYSLYVNRSAIEIALFLPANSMGKIVLPTQSVSLKAE